MDLLGQLDPMTGSSDHSQDVLQSQPSLDLRKSSCLNHVQLISSGGILHFIFVTFLNLIFLNK